MKKNLYIFYSVLICMNMHNSLGMENKKGRMLELPSRIRRSPSCGNLSKFQCIGKLPKDNRQAIEMIAQAHDFLVEILSNDSKDLYGLSIQAINNIWNRLSNIEHLLAALVKNQQILNQESYQYAKQRALIEYKSKKPDLTRPDFETCLIERLLEGVQEEQPALFAHLNELLEKKES